MYRYIPLPLLPISLVNVETDEPLRAQDGTPLTVTGAEVLSTLFRDPQLGQLVDACDLYDLRRDARKAPPGSVLRMKQAEWEALCARLRRPTVLRAELLFSAEGRVFLDAILNASTKNPTEGTPETQG